MNTYNCDLGNDQFMLMILQFRALNQFGLRSGSATKTRFGNLEMAKEELR